MGPIELWSRAKSSSNVCPAEGAAPVQIPLEPSVTTHSEAREGSRLPMEKISVAVRFRPSTTIAVDPSSDRIWKVEDNHISLHWPLGTPISGVSFAFGESLSDPPPLPSSSPISPDISFWLLFFSSDQIMSLIRAIATRWFMIPSSNPSSEPPSMGSTVSSVVFLLPPVLAIHHFRLQGLLSLMGRRAAEKLSPWMARKRIPESSLLPSRMYLVQSRWYAIWFVSRLGLV